jgi:hypothetical protein
VGEAAAPGERVGAWKRLTRPERMAVMISLIAIPALFLPWTSVYYGNDPTGTRNTGLGTAAGVEMLLASIVTLATYLRAGGKRWRRFGPPAIWAFAMVPYPFSVAKVWSSQYPGPSFTLEVGIYIGFLLALGALGATLFAARRSSASAPASP